MKSLPMNKYCLTLIFAALSTSVDANADSFNVHFDESVSDPAEGFEDDCLGDTVADDCLARAATMESELFSLLITLEGEDDAETVTLFQEVLDVDSPEIQSIAVQYLARIQDQPTDFFSKVKTFFFGTHPKLGATAADVMSVAAEEADRDLSNVFREQRSASNYAAYFLDPEGTAEEPLLAACLADARINAMDSFALDEAFAPAERLLMYDRFVFDLQDPTLDYPVTAFVTDADVEDVTAHFSNAFGRDPYPPAAQSQLEMQTLSAELVELQLEVIDGNTDVIERMQEVSDELLALSEVVNVSARFQLQAIYAGDDVWWVDSGAEAAAEGPLPRAVTVGEDARLGRTVIRYIHGAVAGNINDPDPPPDSDAGADPDDEPNSDDGPPADHDTARNDDSGCRMSHGDSSSSSLWPLLAVVSVFWGRRLKLRRSFTKRSPRGTRRIR